MRSERLDNHFPREITTARTTGHLRQKLERALTRAEIRNMQTKIRVENAHQRDVGKMQSLGDHLRANEDIDLVRLEGVQRVPQRVIATHCIRIDPRELRGGQYLRQH